VKFAYILNAVFVAGIAGPTLAESKPPTTTDDEIVVEGRRIQEREVHDFVGALTKAPLGGQLSRFELEACPAAVGLPDAQNRAVADRLRRVAEAVGIPTAKAGCRPNALVIVADDKQALIEGLWQKYPSYFLDKSGDPVKPIVGHGPASAWHVESILDQDGNTPGKNQYLGFSITNSTDSTRLSPSTHPHFVAGVLVVERKALAHLTTTQLADYAVMRLYARTDPTRVNTSTPTILKILDASDDTPIPLTLTEWDFGFLKALYQSRTRQLAGGQRHEIETRLRKELTDSPRPVAK